MIYGIEQPMYYIAWNTSTNQYVTGDEGNHSLFWNKDGVASGVTNAPIEVDAVGQPGLYMVTLTAEETSCRVGRLHGSTSTTDIILIFMQVGPIRLPDVAFNDDDGLPLTGHINNRSLPSADYALEASVQQVITIGGTGPWTTPVMSDVALEASVQQVISNQANQALENTSQQILTDMSDINYWSDTEMEQFRYQIGIEGVTQQPSAIPNLSTFNSATDTVRANVIQIAGDEQVLQNWVRNISTIVATIVSDTQQSPTKTEIYTLLTEVYSDHFKNRAVIVYDGPIAKQASLITGYELVNGEGKLTVAGFTTAPEPGNTLLIV